MKPAGHRHLDAVVAFNALEAVGVFKYVSLNFSLDWLRCRALATRTRSKFKFKFKRAGVPQCWSCAQYLSVSFTEHAVSHGAGRLDAVGLRRAGVGKPTALCSVSVAFECRLKQLKMLLCRAPAAWTRWWHSTRWRRSVTPAQLSTWQRWRGCSSRGRRSSSSTGVSSRNGPLREVWRTRHGTKHLAEVARAPKSGSRSSSFARAPLTFIHSGSFTVAITARTAVLARCTCTCGACDT